MQLVTLQLAVKMINLWFINACWILHQKFNEAYSVLTDTMQTRSFLCDQNSDKYFAETHGISFSRQLGEMYKYEYMIKFGIAVSKSICNISAKTSMINGIMYAMFILQHCTYVCIRLSLDPEYSLEYKLNIFRVMNNCNSSKWNSWLQEDRCK